MSVGFAPSLALDAWARQVANAFARAGGATPDGYVASRPGHFGVYQVGSSVKSKQWRDVDVVLIMENDWFDEMFGTHAGAGHSHDPKWAALMGAFCAWGAAVAGLPIDFKVQRQSWANERFPTPAHPRSALGMASYEREAADADGEAEPDS